MTTPNLYAEAVRPEDRAALPHGSKGESRSPGVTFLLSLLLPIYGLYHLYFKAYPELRGYLGHDDLRGGRDFVVGFLTLGIASIFHYLKIGRAIEEAQRRAGRSDASNKGTTFVLAMILLFPLAPWLVQKELNKAWDLGA